MSVPETPSFTGPDLQDIQEYALPHYLLHIEETQV